MTDNDYFESVFSNADMLARTILVALSDDDVYGDLSDGRKLKGAMTFSLKDITIARRTHIQIDITSFFAAKSGSGISLAAVQIFPGALVNKEPLSILMLGISAIFEVSREYFERGLGYKYIEESGTSAFALPENTLERLYAIDDLKIRFYSLIHEIRKLTLDVSMFYENIGYHPINIGNGSNSQDWRPQA